LFSARGEVMNGGFGLLLDGSEEAAKRASLMLNWDVSNGVRPLQNYRETTIGRHLNNTHSRQRCDLIGE